MCEVTSSSQSSYNTDKEKNNNDDGKKTPSLFLNSNKEIPIVELTLDGVTYKPITSSLAGNKNEAKGNNRTTVLDNVSTTISPYKLTAWMGPSGSGKVRHPRR